MDCIICHEPITNYNNNYVHYCKCKYHAHNECVEKCKSPDCLMCGAQGHKLGNFWCVLMGYLLVTYGGVALITAHIIRELAVY